MPNIANLLLCVKDGNEKKSVLFLQINLLSGAKIYKNAEIHSKTPNLSRRITYV
jgi:hypothetical protein